MSIIKSYLPLLLLTILTSIADYHKYITSNQNSPKTIAGKDHKSKKKL